MEGRPTVGARVKQNETSTPAVCRLSGISKAFGATQALQDVSFEVRKGEFLALIGENGAGKSTTMGILFGLLDPDAGTVEIAGRPQAMRSARDAIAAGLGMVHQHFMLYPDLTVLENIIVGQEDTGRGGRIPLATHRARATEILRDFDFALDLDRKVADLPVDARQQVEIVKLLYRGASVVILDEPTAVLTPQESIALYRMLARLQAQGTSIVLITHKLDEVMDNADRILVMRRGKLVAERATAETNTAELAELMVGDRIEVVEKHSAAGADVVLSVANLTVQRQQGKPALRDVNFEVHAGEVFGIAGVSGNGQKELVNALVGLEGAQGAVRFAGRDILPLDVAARRALGLGYMAEDRMAMGLAQAGSVAENLIAGREGKSAFSTRGFLTKSRIRKFSRDLIDRFDIRTPSDRQTVAKLSGGNQQKIVVARELSARPQLLVVENPCWGVDVGAITFIHKQILELAATGCAVVLVSSDLEELFALSDRVGVLCDGALNAIFPRDGLDAIAVGAAMTGGREGVPA
ncbi:ABC transporter ATP-binding protein [Thalassorhabdomicrobium marinisediminis]|uniref:ABC transporter ATP-binding protein n=1 Tax=Thalassorhabdomicrobium marinisediminis TaxID=2170577 RepID=A0A2T7FTJ0_9RHOB|nr:ABC transporter ATP-binding protein [Thalassorhabdomicrobium marinisediminis]